MNREQLLASIRRITGESDKQIYERCCSELIKQYVEQNDIRGHILEEDDFIKISKKYGNKPLQDYLNTLLPDEGIEGGKRKRRCKRSRTRKSRSKSKRNKKSKKYKKSKKSKKTRS